MGEWYEVELYWPYTRGWQFHATARTRMVAVCISNQERRHGGWTRIIRVSSRGREVVDG